MRTPDRIRSVRLSKNGHFVARMQRRLCQRRHQQRRVRGGTYDTGRLDGSPGPAATRDVLRLRRPVDGRTTGGARPDLADRHTCGTQRPGRAAHRRGGRDPYCQPGGGSVALSEFRSSSGMWRGRFWLPGRSRASRLSMSVCHCTMRWPLRETGSKLKTCSRGASAQRPKVRRFHSGAPLARDRSLPQIGQVAT